MGLRRIIVLLIALVAAGGSAMYARSWIEGQQATIQAVAAPAPKEQIHEVLVADADLPPGTFVKPQHVRWQRWPTDDVPESYVLKGVRSDDEMIGAVVRRRIAIGEPLTDGAV
jgi:pilus assembly protein CpaB